jgi:glutathione S-transferase
MPPDRNVPVILYSYPVSPYAAKVRAILRYKGIAFEEKMVHPMARGIIKELSGQIAIPFIVDGEKVVADSTRIAAYLDERYPDKPVIPTDPVLRARALLLEEWGDEGLPRAVQPVRWFLPQNADATMKLFRSGYAPGALEDAKFKLVGMVLKRSQYKKYGPPSGPRTPAEVLERLAHTLDIVDGALAETGWLAGPEPSVADFAAWGFLNFLVDLDGWETVKTRKRVAKLIKSLGDVVAKPEAYDADDAAMLDASDHRRATQPNKKRLPLA